MNLYNVIVRVGGSLYNEVERLNITAPEVVMLQTLHGDDSIRNITHVGQIEESNASIRERLADYYGTGRIETGRSGGSLVKSCFGPKTMPLPDRVDGVEHLAVSPGFASDPAPSTSLTAE